MKILIELPTWLGDTVMVTPAIENLVNFFDNLEIVLLGSAVSIEALKNHPKVTNTYILEKNYFSIYKSVKNLGQYDAYFSFRSSFRSIFLKFCVSAKKKYQFDKNKFIKGHQVEKYNNFINNALSAVSIPGNLILPASKKKNKNQKNKILGINPGASYGNAKRWYPKEFANVASDLSDIYDILIFGGDAEKDIAADIEKYLIEKGVTNYQNLSAQTSISQLIDYISTLDLFITGDSGPMHIAAAYQIPTVSVFGPTNDKETSQWKNTNGIILKKNLDCQPCMKRSCPLKHHNCMKFLESSDVLEAVQKFN